MIQGEAGVGKTWFLDYLHAEMAARQPTCRLIKRYEASDFVAPFDNLYYRFLRLLKDCEQALAITCLPDLPDPTTATVEQVNEWSGLLEMRLLELRNQPLVLFFDEMEWWVGVPEAQQAALTHLFRTVWAMLLRQAQLPVIITCAGRRIPPFKHPSLRLVQYDYALRGFPAAQLITLVDPAKQSLLRPLIERYTEDNPWATQVLEQLYARLAAFGTAQISEPVLREVFEAIVGDQLDQNSALKETLYQLAKQKQTGFTANDPLLPEGDATLIKLMNSSFVEFNSNAKRYFVIPVLARWFKRSDQNDPQ
ncbi:MAG: ATP-binding protein [Caldilinea sp. CFX5]|nr:ATP-binding protein [Caldilinea sp. CFX5]